jgi:hypothetical protein
METINHLLIRLYVSVTVPPERDERGDVPGWVLITVMTAALVTVIYKVADDRLATLLRNALKDLGT